MTHNEFEETIKKEPIGNKGCVILPWWTGERSPNLPKSVPIYFGFGLNDLTEEKICRGVLEGHIMHLYDNFLKLGITPKEIRITGGLAKSKIWRNTIANVFECDVLPIEGEGAATGAAIHAAWAFYKEFSIQEIAQNFVLIDEEFREKPEEKAIEIYRILKKIYVSLSKLNRGLKSLDNPFDLKNEIQKLY